jgi:DNA-binding SARP family transcriptional activator
LSRGLLPDWLDDWLLMDRERWDQVRLHALETLACRLLAAEHHLAALEAAFAAVAIEPVRESAHRTVVEIYLAEGNPACALQHFQRYRRLVQRELGVAPSSRMHQLIQPIAS